ncbi:hypothetical protein [Actinoalloteichus hymeniacidonis]|uniref:DUF3558 family protein n=1 Tax=Actinoalloteichus hymeniacidonis TaxID=340345 RepID=A0AAC9MY63_9PSEU|nr:hypothetical protein [Actinoalloteichus hymeniacidonis]AOS62551.1 hypothetical protein TL08_08680 [Actinoalloteichus hymeniacidonis]MBB5909418.1 hypothetical protein [Actinoalloteichus hymeniacidonis]
MSQRSLTTAISAVLLVFGLGACATPVAGTASPEPGAGSAQPSEDSDPSAEDDGGDSDLPSIPLPDPQDPTSGSGDDSGGGGSSDGAKDPESVASFCELVSADEIGNAVGSPNMGEPSDYSTICSYSIDLDGTSYNYLGFGTTNWSGEPTEEGQEAAEVLGKPGYRLVTEDRCDLGMVINEDPNVYFNAIYVDLDTFGNVTKDLCPSAEATIQLIYDALPSA